MIKKVLQSLNRNLWFKGSCISARELHNICISKEGMLKDSSKPIKANHGYKIYQKTFGC